MSSISSISSSVSSMFSIEQQKRKQDLFTKVDSDGNGGVSQTELTALTGKIAQDSGKTLDASSLLSQYDSNSDGSLNSDEMDSLMESIKPKHERDAMLSSDEESSSQTSSLDTNSLASYLSNSGQDLVASLISMLQQMQSSSSADEDSSSGSSSAIGSKQGPPPPPPSPEEMFKKVDSDSSGAVSSDELQTMLDKMAEMTGQSQDASALITQYDSDSDGSLNSAEMDSMMKSMGPPSPPPQMAQSDTSSDQDSSSQQDALASFLQNADQNSLSALLKMLKSSASSSSSSQSVNVLS